MPWVADRQRQGEPRMKLALAMMLLLSTGYPKAST
jgi:hypothetical protein